MTRRIVLVGCGKAKYGGRLPAREMYKSNYFKMKRQLAELLTEAWEDRDDVWFVLSAKYGLLDPDREIDDYNASLKSSSDHYIGDETRQEWADEVLEDLNEVITNTNAGENEELPLTRIYLLAGQDYIDPIEDRFEEIQDEHNGRVSFTYPFEDTGGMGDQMAKMKKEISRWERKVGRSNRGP